MPKLIIHINSIIMKCQNTNCKTQANYGIIRGNAIHCKKHKTDDEVNVMSKICIEDGCNHQPSYGLIRGNAIHCKEHKADNEIDVISKRCVENGCDVRPIFGLIGGRAVHCKKHKADNEINLKSKRCIEDGCNIHASFGLIGGRVIHCKKHRADNEIDLKSKRCIEDGCSIRPLYGLIEGTAVHCRNHKLDDECNIHPSFGLIGGRAVHCKKHRTDNEVNVVLKRCIEDTCNIAPTFGLIRGHPIHCKQHKKDNEYDVVSILCTNCKYIRINSKFKPNCTRCHYYLNPNDPHIRNYKTREQAFMLPLKEVYPEIVLDKIISGGCSKRRPDGMIDCFTHVVIVEIDEDQHIGYDNICDNKRTMEIFSDLGNRPIIFIRLNPDGYTQHNKRIGKVFSIMNNGELRLNKKEFEHRYNALIETIDSAIRDIPSREISIIQLFFNDI